MILDYMIQNLTVFELTLCLEITSFKSCEQSNLCSIFKERIPQVGDVALNLSLPLKIQLLAIWSPFNQY